MKKALVIILSLLVSLTLLSGCSSKKDSEADLGDQAAMGDSQINLQREARFAEGSTIPTAESGGMFRDVQFDFDSAEISDRGLQNIEYNVQILQNRTDVKIQLEGHTDERGTAEYNLALGQERARSVYEVLSSYGISPGRLQTISFGEEVPLDPNSNEASWAKNRRVHFAPFQ